MVLSARRLDLPFLAVDRVSQGARRSPPSQSLSSTRRPQRFLSSSSSPLLPSSLPSGTVSCFVGRRSSPSSISGEAVDAVGGAAMEDDAPGGPLRRMSSRIRRVAPKMVAALASSDNREQVRPVSRGLARLADYYFFISIASLRHRCSRILSPISISSDAR